MAWFNRKCYRDRSHHGRCYRTYAGTTVNMWAISVLACCLRIIKKERG
jgi:hypothetical protein